MSNICFRIPEERRRRRKTRKTVWDHFGPILDNFQVSVDMTHIIPIYTNLKTRELVVSETKNIHSFFFTIHTIPSYNM
jgi:hypothetical protein